MSTGVPGRVAVDISSCLERARHISKEGSKSMPPTRYTECVDPAIKRVKSCTNLQNCVIFGVCEKVPEKDDKYMKYVSGTRRGV